LIPYKVLNFVFAEINYGGRVTDYIDGRLMRNIIESYIKPEVLTDSFKFSGSGLYRSIEAGSYDDYLNYVRQLPQNPEPEAFGLHDNAEITTNQNETRTILENVLSIQPRASSGAGKSREEQIGELAAALQAKTPPAFDVDDVQTKYKTDYNESMNTVLTQEVIRYNRLLVVMAQMLSDV
jgi:dynein heavy chain